MGVGFFIKAIAFASDIVTLVPGGWATIATVTTFVGTLLFSGALCYWQKRDFIRRLEIASKMKHKASHILRDKTYDLIMTNIKENFDDNSRLKWTTTELKNTGREFVTLVSEILNSLSGQQVNVCIKAIENPRQPLPTKKEDWKNIFVYTLCRSPKSRHQIKMSERESVADNTDFLLIMKDEGNVFYVPNLKKFDKGQRKLGNRDGYMNSTKNWFDFYKTAIVVPIRIEMSLIGGGESGYDLLGFLCADSLSTCAFPRRYQSLYGELMLSFGDDLYHYFEIVTTIGQKLLATQQPALNQIERSQ